MTVVDVTKYHDEAFKVAKLLHADLNTFGAHKATYHSKPDLMCFLDVVLSELAVVLFLGLDPNDPEINWNPYVTDRSYVGTIDICGIVEVKHVHKPDNPLKSFAKSNKPGVIDVKTFVEHKPGKGTDLVHILGWQFGEMTWLRGTVDETGDFATWPVLSSPNCLQRTFELERGKAA